MSRVIQQIASVQFQVQNRQANAAMQALQEAAKDLSKNMDEVNKKIAALGKDIPKDNPQLLNYQNQLRSLDKDLKDVQKAQRDFLRGAKAADQLWKAAQEQNIEILSFRAIKAGQNGLRKRQEGLSPGDAKDMQDWRIIKQVIDEADRVVKEAGADVQHVIQTIREGGKVSEQTMRQTISTLKELKGSVDETDADFGKWGTDLDFMEAKLKDFSEAQRRARGEIVDANDARREMNKLTEEGAAAAKREAEEADRLVQQYKAEGEELARKRGEIKANIEATQQQIDNNHKIIEEKHRQLAADEETFNAEQQGRRATIEGLKTQAEAERKLANEKSDAAETQRRAAELQKQTTEQLTEKVMKLQDQLEVERQTNEERGKSNKQSKEELRLKGELETAQGKLAESKKRENEEQQQSVKLQTEAIEQGNKAAAAENKVADAQSEAIQKQVDFNKKQQEGLDNINQMAQGNQALQQSIDGLNGELEQNSKDYADNATKTAEAEAKKAKARQLSIKTMEDMLAKLKEEYYTEELTAEKRAEHKQKIKELDEALRLAKGEWMSYGDAMKYANSIGSDGFMATDEQTKMATDALTRHREELIKTIQQKEADGQATATERAELEKLNQALMKIKTGFSSADDVMARWAEHMNAGKTTTESMNQQTKTLAQTLEEKLAGATSTWDERIERQKKSISEYNEEISEYDQKIKKFTENIEKMEKELAELEQKHANSSWFRKRTREYSNEGWRIEDLRTLIGNERTAEDGSSYMTGEKGELAFYKELKKSKEEYKEWWENELKDSYRLKAAELGITEEEVAAEEKKAEAKKLTNEQMQQGINLLEEEYAKTDHTTEEGIKRRQELRTAIDQMNQELKESTGEWMSLADAKNLAEKAGTDGFMTSPQEIQKATQALERHRDAIIQTIKAKRDSGAATDAEEKELTDLTKKLKDLKFEQDNFNMSQAKMQELMRTPTNAVSLDELKAAIKRADGELKRMEGSLGKNSTKYKEFAAEVKNAKNVMKEMEGQAKASATAWEKAWSRLKTYVGLYMGFNIVWQKVQGAASDLMTLSDKMGEVRKTTGFTAEEVGRLSNNLAKLDTRTSLQELMSISAIAGSIGLKTQEQVQGFTEAAQELTVALPEMGDEAARTLMKIADATGDLEKNGGDVRETLERVGSTIIALRANSAAAAGPITDFVSRVGAVGAQAGISIDQIAALGATVDALGGRVEMSATALSRMIPAIKNNAFAVAQAIGMTEKELKGKTGMEQMVAIFRSLHDSVKGFDTSTEKGMNAMADSVEKALGRSASMQEVMKTLNQQGARAGIVFGLLSQNVDKLEEQLDLAGKAYRKNTALMNEYSNMNETAAAKWARLTNQIEEFFVNADATSWLSDIIDMLRVLADLVTDEGPLGRLTRYTVVYLTMMKSGWAESIGKAVLAVYEYVFAIDQATAATVADTAATTADTGAKIANAAASETAAAAQGALNKTMKANIITAVLTAVVALGMALYDYSKKAKEAAKQMDVMADVEKKAKEASIDERVQLEKLYRVTQDQTASIEERKKALKDMVGDAKYQEYYSKLSTESELASAAASAYKELSEQILATARARALDAEAEELQRKRIKLENQKSEREQWENENRGRYRQEQQQYQQQQRYVGRVTGGAMAGFQESQIAQQGASAMKPAIIDEFEGSIRERNRIQTEIEQIDSDLDKLKKQVGELNIKSDTDNGGGSGGGSNPYGDYNDRIDPYEQWDANALVARRKEMLERVRALANGADVQAVLSEDKRFMDEATRKGIKNMRDAIAWYNEERLKIQEELHSRNLTNTGDWMDPKKSGSKRKPKTPESEAAIAELDRYYLERKELIEEARSKEEMTEAEYNRRLDALEQEHLTKRSELRQTFTSEDRQFIQQFRQWWASVEELDEVSWETIEAEWMAAWERDRKYNNREAQKDLTAMQAIIVKQLHEIEAIINKERPFNGITTNLQDNLTKMGLLFKDGVEGTMEENTKRLTFLLKESEDAYSLTFEQLAEDMRKNGFGAWADAIIKSENADKEKRAIIAQLHSVYDAVQEAIKKEASLVKKQVDIAWNDAILPNGKSIKATYEAAISGIGVEQGRVSRANSLIGAGQASERVADKLAIKQMQLQLAMQEHYYNFVKLTGWQRINDLRRQADEQRKLKNLAEAEKLDLDAKHALMSLNLSLAKEETELAKQQEDIIARTEESQNRLYKELREWGDLLASSMQSIFEASHAGDAEYYNEQAKLNLTGKGGPGAGTYIVIDNEGTNDALAHYEYLDERQALERQREIENQNAQADAWKKVMEDINMKMSDMITDQINASLQKQSIDQNTSEVISNTEQLAKLNEQLAQGIKLNTPDSATGGTDTPTESTTDTGSSDVSPKTKRKMDEDDKLTDKAIKNAEKRKKAVKDETKEESSSTQSAFAKMTQAVNMYGIAYQAVTNENLSTTQKFEMMALQAVGNYAISSLTAVMSEAVAKGAVNQATVLGKLWSQLGWAAPPVFAIFTGLLGAAMGVATNAISKSKSQISQVTGASVGAGRLSTGMLTYAEGNVNEFTDPSTLTPGRSYNVDAADGRTYRAKYTGSNPRTHITNGPEFHLVGEAGREAIIDAKTTRNIQLNEPEIWRSIQTLYNGGVPGMRRTSRMGRGVRAYADGNLDDFEEMDGMGETGSMGGGMSTEMMMSLQASMDRQSDLLERALNEGIKGVFDVHGSHGLVSTYDRAKKEAQRHGVKYT